jgi:hypothetical protein
MTATPPWIADAQWMQLNPPAEVLALGEMPRAPEKLLAVPKALNLLTAKRYAPIVLNGVIQSTYCNIFVSDATTVLRAPLPHKFDLGDKRGLRELNANEMVDGLRAGKFDGWSVVGTMASASAVISLAGSGWPCVAVWKNPQPKKDSAGRVITVNGVVQYHSGHVVLVVPPPAGKRGVYVSGAGARCVDQCLITDSFGIYTPQVEFYSHQ